MFNLWSDRMLPEATGPAWVQTCKESRRTYIRTDRFRVCLDFIDFIQMGEKATDSNVKVVLIYMEGRKDFLRLDRDDAQQFLTAWDELTQ